MENLNTYLLDAKSALEKHIELEPLIQAAHHEDMLSLSRNDMDRHEMGLFLTTSLEPGMPAVGYVACKQLFNATPQFKFSRLISPHNVIRTGLIGSLYLEPGLRGQGLAKKLVKTITDQVFSTRPGVQACMSDCNARSAFVFGGVGYKGIASQPNGKLRYVMTKTDWQTSVVGQA